jgi:hypothetical protein
MTGGTSSSGPGSPPPTGYIASGQGFFVEAITATPVVFNNGMRNKTFANNNFYRTAQSASEPSLEKDRIWINLGNSEGLFSQQLIGYFDNATLDYDRAYDGMVNQTSNTVSFYSFIGSDKYRIQARPAFTETDLVPLGFSTTMEGTYSIGIDHAEGILADENTDVYLDDKLLGITHDLKAAPYQFTTQTGMFNDRFVLRYTEALGIDNPQVSENSVIAFGENNNIVIKSLSEKMKSVEVYDITGRQLFKAGDINENEFRFSEVSLSNQTLIVKVLLTNGQSVSRKIVF